MLRGGATHPFSCTFGPWVIFRMTHIWRWSLTFTLNTKLSIMSYSESFEKDALLRGKNHSCF